MRKKYRIKPTSSTSAHPGTRPSVSGVPKVLEVLPKASPVMRQEDGRLVIHARAKLNLGLRVFPARPDGFHDLETWMVPISWHDTITIRTGGPLKLVVTGRSEGVPTDLEKNLVGKAALKLAAAGRIPPTGTIELHKVLPTGGGIGGGSADAGSVLVALNEAWVLGLTDRQLQDIAAEVGSDVPFFVQGRSSLCTGRGEIMTPMRSYHSLFAVLILPPRGLPTKDVYQGFDKGHQHQNAPRSNWCDHAAAPAEKLNDMLINDLEPAAFAIAPWLSDLRNRASKILGQKVHLTGSGSTLFSLCASGLIAGEMQEKLMPELKWDALCVPVRILRQR